MKITVSIYNLEQLNNRISKLDFALLNIPKYSLLYEDLDLDAAISICKKNNKGYIIALNKILHEGDLASYKDLIKKYKDSECLFYVTDLGLANILIKEGLESRTIYNPETMIANYLDLSIYQDLGFNAMAMSEEITLSDLKLSYEKTKAPLFYLGFGYRMMFYSKRHLITTYQKKIGNTDIIENSYLKEEKRNDYYPVIENNNGTMIFRSYLISLIPYFDEINFLKYFHLESFRIDEDTFDNVLDLVYKLNNNIISKDFAIDSINEMNLNIQEGFIFNDSVYQKEVLKK